MNAGRQRIAKHSFLCILSNLRSSQGWSWRDIFRVIKSFSPMKVNKTFRRTISPPSSGSMSKLSKNPASCRFGLHFDPEDEGNTTRCYIPADRNRLYFRELFEVYHTNVGPIQRKSCVSIYSQVLPSTPLCILRWNLVLGLHFPGMQSRAVWYIPQDRSIGIHCQ